MTRQLRWFSATLILIAAAIAVPVTLGNPGTATYRVTLVNLTSGQPFSPPVAATHSKAIRMFQVGKLASDELAAIAQDGEQIPMFNLFNGSDKVTDVVDVGRPLTRNGTTVGMFTDSATFMLEAAPGDKLSLSTMLICTNDGFLGLDAVELPKSGAAVFLLNGYDAGRELNTQQSVDIVDPCTGLGPVPLPGDPDGNEDDAVENSPPTPIVHHPNIVGAGELSPGLHGWTDPVARVTVERIG